MKERLNLTVDRKLLEIIKGYAASKHMSVSELVENYFLSVTRPVPGNNILDLMDRLEPPVVRGRDGNVAGVEGSVTGVERAVTGVKDGGGHGV
ncbi:MAG TPA: DUF6364 family protein [Puia sp.]|jgi:hypothetical protein|nr:DUF6364 family protein [Puia sp.]